MTDARLPDRLLNDRRLQRLQPQHFKAYVNGLMWSVSNRTDGVILPEDLALIPGFSAGSDTVLADAGLWKRRKSDGWLIEDYAATQSSRSQLEALEGYRKREREEKARQRARRRADAAALDDTEHGPSPRTVPPDRRGGHAGSSGRPTGQSGGTSQDRTEIEIETGIFRGIPTSTTESDDVIPVEFVGGDSSSDASRVEGAIVRKLEREGDVTRRNLQQTVARPLREHFQPVFEGLVAAQVVREVHGDGRSKLYRLAEGSRA
jgi:hypothetical protein